MKDVKYCLEQFAFYDHAAIQEQLEARAQEGWLVEKVGNFLWKYRRIEPKKLHIAVTYFPNASDFDPEPTDGQQMMEDFAKRDGWNIACRWGQMQIFYNEEENPIPIETDAVTQVETIHRAMRKRMLPTYFFILFLCIYEWIGTIWKFQNNPIDFLSAPASLYRIPAWILLIIPIIIELVFYFRWYKKAKILAEETGNFLAVRLNHKVSFIFIALSILLIIISFTSSGGTTAVAMVIWTAAMIINAVIVNIIKNWMKKKGIPRGVNRFLSVCIAVICVLIFLSSTVFVVVNYGIGDSRKAVGTYELYGRTHEIYNDPLPLEIEDIMEIEGQWSKEMRGTQTILVSQMEYEQDSVPMEGNAVPDLSYTITDIKVPFLYEFCKKSLLNEHQDEIEEDFIFYDSYFLVDATIWNAKEAYQLRWSSSILNTYLICWENRIVEIKFYWEPTVEQIAKVAEILGVN